MEAIGAVILVLGGLVGLTALIVLGAFIRGFVLTKLWAWFIVPTFGAPRLSIPIAIGISLIVGLLIEKVSQHKDDRETSDKVAGMLATFVAPFIVLFMGWIVQMFV